MILIENMEMPESCKDCPLQYDATEGGAEYCCLLDEYVGSRKTERLPNCPLREVTERKKDEYVAWLENQIAWDNKKCIGGKE